MTVIDQSFMNMKVYRPNRFVDYMKAFTPHGWYGTVGYGQL